MGAGEPPIVPAGQPFLVRIRGWAFCAFTLISALFGSIYIITPLLPLMIISPRCWRKCMDRLVGIWVAMPGPLMTYIFGTNVRVRGDMIDHSKPAVIIMNHRSRLDWLYFWNALFTMDPWLCTSEKITLKGVLKYLPGAGLFSALYFLHCSIPICPIVFRVGNVQLTSQTAGPFMSEDITIIVRTHRNKATFLIDIADSDRNTYEANLMKNLIDCAK